MSLNYEKPFLVQYTRNPQMEAKEECDFASYEEANRFFIEKMDLGFFAYFWEIGSFEKPRSRAIVDEWFCFRWHDPNYLVRMEGRGSGLRVSSMEQLWGYVPHKEK
jgi:hypothetical protein